MISLKNASRILLSKAGARVYSAVCAALTGRSSYSETPKAPEDFSPLLRFMVCSDIHINGESGQKEPLRFIEAVEAACAYAEKEKYQSLDAVCVCGDFTDEGSPFQYEIFNSCVGKALKENTRLLICSGNHEYIYCRENKDNSGERACDIYKKMLGREEDEHHIINGYHFISASYDPDKEESFRKKKKWLDAEIRKAVSDTAGKPVFVFQHPHPFGTVFGSVNWGDISVSQVLKKYPQVVDFSGHSHYPINDPRSIWQGSFTALGTGTLSYFETELDYISGVYPYDKENAAQFYIVEADKDGNVRILPYDLITHSFFDNEYYLTGLSEKKYDYTYNKMKKRDCAPVFNDNAEISAELDESGETVLKFDGAKANFIIDSYKITVRASGNPKSQSYNIPGKYMFLYMENKYEVNLGKLESGKHYKAEIIAMNAFSQASKPLVLNFTAQ